MGEKRYVGVQPFMYDISMIAIFLLSVSYAVPIKEEDRSSDRSAITLK